MGTDSGMTGDTVMAKASAAAATLAFAEIPASTTAAVALAVSTASIDGLVTLGRLLERVAGARLEIEPLNLLNNSGVEQIWWPSWWHRWWPQWCPMEDILTFSHYRSESLARQEQQTLCA